MRCWLDEGVGTREGVGIGAGAVEMVSAWVRVWRIVVREDAVIGDGERLG